MTESNENQIDLIQREHSAEFHRINAYKVCIVQFLRIDNIEHQIHWCLTLEIPKYNCYSRQNAIHQR